jgi:hypothetical protein
MEGNPDFALNALVSAGTKGWLNPPSMVKAAAAGGTKGFVWNDPVTMLNLARQVQTGTPPSNPSEVGAFYSTIASGITSLVSAPRPSQALLRTGASSIVNALYQGVSGLRTTVDASHRVDALPALHRDVARLTGASLVPVQQAVTAELEAQGVDPIELAVKDATITFRSKILPALRTWDQGLMINRTNFTSSGGKIKLDFTAPIASENPAIRSIANSPSLGTNAVRDSYINKDVRMIESRLNEMVESYSNLTGKSKEDIAEGILAQFNIMMELEKGRSK